MPKKRENYNNEKKITRRKYILKKVEFFFAEILQKQ